MCNGQLDQESKRKLLDICGIDSFDHNDPSGFIKQNMYKEFLYSIQMKGVRLAKDFRQHGIPYVQRLDTYVKGIEDPEDLCTLLGDIKIKKFLLVPVLSSKDE